MTIQKTLSSATRVLVEWKECGVGREARVLEQADPRGNKVLAAETRPVDAYKTIAHPAQVKVDIPHLSPLALQRHRSDSQLRLTSSPSLNHLTVDLCDARDIEGGNQYSGAWANCWPHGNGWLVDSGAKPQRHYIGEFNEGWFTGSKNRIEYADGRWYEGGTNKGTRQGKGTLRCPNRYVYTGDWQNNLKHGVGREEFDDGSGYEGSWVNDQRDGQGVAWTPEGARYDGAWSKGSTTGAATLTTSDGHSYRLMNGKPV